MNFEAGQHIFHEGDHGELFYIIEEGEVSCIKEQDASQQVIRTLSQGMHFGEIALINNVKRTLSVKTESKVKLLCLAR